MTWQPGVQPAYGYPPVAPVVGLPPVPFEPVPFERDSAKLPAGVRVAGIMMITLGSIYMLIVTTIILSGQSTDPLWLNVVNYLIAAVNVAVPIVMLMRKRWAYSMSVSILVAMVLLIALEIISSGLWFNATALPLVVLAIIVVASIYGIPLMLLVGKKARAAFEDPHSLSAAVWAGGGWQFPGTEPFAWHPSERPPYLAWMPTAQYVGGPVAQPGWPGAPGPWGMAPAGAWAPPAPWSTPYG